MSHGFTESIVEDAALAWLEALGYAVLHGPAIAAGEPGAERSDPAYRDVVLDGRLRQALFQLNPDLPYDALEDAYRKLTRSDASSLVERNRALHRMLVNGITVEYRRKDGSLAGAQAGAIDFDAPNNNDALPHAPFIGFTGTPIEKTDANTRAVFGDYISVYDIQRAVVDGATVPIYYEGRLAQLKLKDSERPKIDPEFEEATEGEEVERKEKLKTRWAQLEAVVGSENRIKLIARDLVEHFENRTSSASYASTATRRTSRRRRRRPCLSRRKCSPKAGRSHETPRAGGLTWACGRDGGS